MRETANLPPFRHFKEEKRVHMSTTSWPHTTALTTWNSSRPTSSRSLKLEDSSGCLGSTPVKVRGKVRKVRTWSQRLWSCQTSLLKRITKPSASFTPLNVTSYTSWLSWTSPWRRKNVPWSGLTDGRSHTTNPRSTHKKRAVQPSLWSLRSIQSCSSCKTEGSHLDPKSFFKKQK